MSGIINFISNIWTINEAIKHVYTTTDSGNDKYDFLSSISDISEDFNKIQHLI